MNRTTKPRIYLDNAATSWPKPQCVYDAVDRYQREIGVAGGRSSYYLASEAGRIIDRARRSVAELVGADSSDHVVFCCNGTEALNTAIQGAVCPGDHVVTTVCEHNSVLRPLQCLADRLPLEVSYARCDQAGYVDPDEIRKLLRTNTRLVVVVHASNVTGAVQPVAEIGAIVREHHAWYLVDAAQTLGHVPITFAECCADLIAAPGHKGLLGPFGTGVLCMGTNVADRLGPLKMGGTGTSSDLSGQPMELPYRFESGNLNMLGIAGLAAALDFLDPAAVRDAISERLSGLTSRLLAGLQAIDGVVTYGPQTARRRASVVSFNVTGYDPQELATTLETSAGIECRAGLHCAPKMHQALGTIGVGGTVRLSLGWATTFEQVETTLDAVNELAASPIL